MSTKLSSSFKISGVVDTNKSVMTNVDVLSTAAGCWTTFDVNEGKWAVVINEPSASVKSFNDSNIIGSISVSTTAIRELYNSVQIEYPNKDLLDEKDTVVYTLNSASRYPNEQDNVLNFSIDCVNEPIQVESLAVRELKQSRVDKVIQFRTDFTSMGLKAGDVIDVTASMYGFSAKKFRILSTQEEDADDGVLAINITAFEYDEGIYNTTGLTRKARTAINDIVQKSCNTATNSSDNEANLPLDLSNVAKALGLLLTFNALTGRWELSQGGQQVSIAGDHAVINWTFPDGQDLDIRCRLVSPFLGQSTIDDYIGWTGDPAPPLTPNPPFGSTVLWSAAGVPVLIWGGDNQGAGEETVYVNLEKLKEIFPTQQYFIVECRGNWFGTAGTRPVQLTANLYEGGTVTPPSGGGFSWTVTGATKTRFCEGVSVFVDSNYGETIIGGIAGFNAPGDLMGYFVFDPYNDIAYFRNDLTGLI